MKEVTRNILISRIEKEKLRYLIFSLLFLLACSFLINLVSAADAFKEKILVSNGSIILDDLNISNLTIQAYNRTWLEFDGRSGSVDLSHNNQYDFLSNTGYTISVWVNPRSNREGSRVFTIEDRIGYLAFSPSRWSFVTSNTLDSHILNSKSYINFNRLQNVVVTLKNESKSIYVNGKNENTESTNIIPDFTQDRKAKIGSSWDGASLFFNGSIDDFRIYNSPLLGNQIDNFFDESSYGNGSGTRIPQIYYHAIVYNGQSYHIAPKNFGEQMSYLNASGYKTITFSEYYNWKLYNNFSMPKKPIIIVFDDGHMTSYTIAYLNMGQYGFRGVIAIPSDNIDREEKLSSWQLKDLLNHGWEIASHSKSHLDLKSISYLERMTQFNESKNVITSKLSYIPSTFIFPYNSFNSTLITEAMGFYNMTSGYSAYLGSNDLPFIYKDDNLSSKGLVRIEISNSTTLKEFKEYLDFESSLLLKYNFNENMGTIAHDSSGNHNDGIMSGAKWKNDGALKTLKEGTDYTFNATTREVVPSNEYLYAWLNITYHSRINEHMPPEDKFTFNNTWLEFDGKDDYVEVNPLENLLGIDSTFTIAGYFKYSNSQDTPIDSTIFSHTDTAKNNLAIIISDANASGPSLRIYNYKEPEGYSGVSSCELNKDKWYYFNYQYKGITKKGMLLIDNKEPKQIGSPPSFGKDIGAFIGKSVNNTSYFEGSLSEISIYSGLVFTNLNDPNYLEDTSTIPSYPNYPVSYEPYDLVDYEGVSNPILSIENTGASVADPFLFIDNGTYYLFFERIGDNGDIALATSKNGIIWEYQGILINEEYHMSYPYVFKYNDTYYLIPQAGSSSKPGDLYVYTSSPFQFPYIWTKSSVLFNGTSRGGSSIVDAVIFRWEEKWWIIYYGNSPASASLDLYAGYCQELLEPSTCNWDLPINPIYNKTDKDRPGGRPIVRKDGIVLFLQDETGEYGNNTRVHRINTLNSTAFSMYELLQSPMISRDETGWNSNSSHNVDCWWQGYQAEGNKYICAVDGRNSIDEWSIGIYQSNNSGLIGEWNLDENSGTIAHDSSGNKNNGAISGATWNSSLLKDNPTTPPDNETVPDNETEPPIEEDDDIVPIITSTLPEGGFATGTFEVGFIEENPEELSLIYGNKTDLRGESIELNSCEKDGEESYCSVNADLSEFDGQNITYYFHLEDAAGNYDEPEKVNLKVDFTPPILNRLDYSVSYNYFTGRRQISYKFNVSEPNFDSIKYVDIKNGKVSSSGTLCSSLNNGICTATKTITVGKHYITIQMLDLAGNSDSFNLVVYS